MATETERGVKQAHEQHYSNPDDWQEYAARGKEQIKEMVSDNAGRSMLLALSAGLGVGLLLGAALGGSSESSRKWGRNAAEGLGRRMLDKFEGLVPDAVSDRFNK